MVAAELELAPLIAPFPPRSTAHPLPAFPPIQRDLSLIVDDPTPWSRIREAALGAKPAMLETIDFVGNYRGKPLAAGKKSVTMRLTFRDPARTLRHDEVDPQIAAVLAAATRDLGASLRQ